MELSSWEFEQNSLHKLKCLGGGGVWMLKLQIDQHMRFFVLHIYFTPSFRAIPPLKLGMLCWTMVQTTVTFTT